MNSNEPKRPALQSQIDEVRRELQSARRNFRTLSMIVAAFVLVGIAAGFADVGTPEVLDVIHTRRLVIVDSDDNARVMIQTGTLYGKPSEPTDAEMIFVYDDGQACARLGTIEQGGHAQLTLLSRDGSQMEQRVRLLKSDTAQTSFIRVYGKARKELSTPYD